MEKKALTGSALRRSEAFFTSKCESRGRVNILCLCFVVYLTSHGGLMQHNVVRYDDLAD